MPFYLVTWIGPTNYIILLRNNDPSNFFYLDLYLVYLDLRHRINFSRHNVPCLLFKQTGLFIKQQTNNTLQQKKIYTFSTY